MEPQGSRIVKRRQRAWVLQLIEDAAVEYLLKYPPEMFRLKIQSTDAMSIDTNKDGSCGYRAIWQASQRVYP